MEIPHTPHTIAAISTPPGRGGIGIVRLSGPDALTIATRLLLHAPGLAAPEAHARARFARVLDPQRPGHALDDALVTAFHPPHSFTGEPLVEIATHGAPVILHALLQHALRHGAQLAAPGEFTQRAFLAGRLDLTQAEAVHDLIAAQTLDQARVAAQQLGGALSRRIRPLKDQLVHLIALLEAGMDFASGELDDVDVVPPAQIAAAVAAIAAPLQALAETFRRGQLLRNGVAIALIGRPNAGKSSLFNRLLERDRAIVTPVPGTTRDTLEESLSLAGIPVRLIDTAGLRSHDDPALDAAEALGIDRTRQALADADLVLHVIDASQPADTATPLAPGDTRPCIRVHNKIDLVPHLHSPGHEDALCTSALTGQGLEGLRSAVLTALNASGSLTEAAGLNTLRHQHAVAEALQALDTATSVNASGLPHELLLLDLHAALRALDTLTGTTTTDDILARIFSTFCIGK